MYWFLGETVQWEEVWSWRTTASLECGSAEDQRNCRSGWGITEESVSEEPRAGGQECFG